MDLALLFACHLAAWTLALMFLRTERKKCACTALLSALLAVLCSLLLLWLGHPGLEALSLAAASLVTALVLAEGLHFTRRDAAAAFLLAQGGGRLLWGGMVCPPVGLVLLGGFAVLTALLAPRFPAPGWRELLAEQAVDEGRPLCRSWYPDAVFVFLCAAVNAAALLPAEGLTAAALDVLLALLYWGGLLLVIFMTEYQRVSLAAISEKQYREEMGTFMNVIRAQRHDYNFHVRTLSGLLRNGTVEDCRAYVDDLVQDTVAMNQVLPIQDPAISATIYSFQVLAAQSGITLHVDVQYDLSHISTSVYETNKIISNLLQNAIDEVGTHADKSYGIWLYILKRGQFCLIHTANQMGASPVSGDVFRPGYTTKTGHSGIGLSSVQALAERHHGLVYIRQEGGIVHFVAQIPL